MFHDILLDETDQTIQAYCVGCDWVGTEHDVADHGVADLARTRVEASVEGSEHTATVSQ